jgi:alkylation response protein AidB-like acyl-CoA dehydrogenase
VDVRPLRELTGEALFNEVFLDDVFVPDDCVVGEVGQGWRVARATLGNERVSIGGAARARCRSGPGTSSRSPRRRRTRTTRSERSPR